MLRYFTPCYILPHHWTLKVPTITLFILRLLHIHRAIHHHNSFHSLQIPSGHNQIKHMHQRRQRVGYAITLFELCINISVADMHWRRFSCHHHRKRILQCKYGNRLRRTNEHQSICPELLPLLFSRALVLFVQDSMANIVFKFIWCWRTQYVTIIAMESGRRVDGVLQIHSSLLAEFFFIGVPFVVVQYFANWTNDDWIE